MKFFLFEFLSVISYFSIRLYFFANKFFVLSYDNRKLNEYIKKDRLHTTTSNFDNTKFENLSSNNLLNVVSPSKYKQVFYILLITFAIIALNVAFRYKYIFSNFIYINIVNKNIDLVSLLSDKYTLFRNIYFLIYIICTFDIIYNCFTSKLLYKIYLFLSKSKNNYKNEKEENEILRNQIMLGKKGQKNIYINKLGIYQNILITGSIGSGKTSAAITNILDGLIKNKMSGLIIDVKGNYIDMVEKVAKKYDRLNDVVKITLDDDFKYNPLNNNMNDIELANMLKKVIVLLSNKNNGDSFWLDKVENYLRDFICLTRAYNTYVSFYEIHNLVSDEKYLFEKLELIKSKILDNKFCDEDLFKINNSLNNIKKEFLQLDTRTLNIIKAEITRITSIFVSNYNLYNKFCFDSEKLDFFNKIVVLSINIGENKVLSKVISTYMKLEFQKEVLSKNINTQKKDEKKSLNSVKSVFFVCDEYQEVCNEEDAIFFSISREYKCVNVVSMQSYTSLLNALNSEYAAKVIIQNLVNKIWFRNDDNFTISEIIKQVGKELKSYEVKNIAENGNNTKYSIINNGFVDYKTGITKGYTYNNVLEFKLNEEYFTTKLKSFEAVCMLSTGDGVEYVDKVIFKRWEC